MLLLQVLAMSLLPYLSPVLAQELEATKSAQANLPTTSELPIPTELPKLPLTEETVSDTAGSANLRPKPQLRQLDKQFFLSHESVVIRVANAQKQDINLELVNQKTGERPNVLVKQEEINNEVFVTLSPGSAITPGKYTLTITDFFGQTLTQDFTWGVLAINPNKSLYLPNETANLAMAVLDEKGEMVCDADLTLIIKSPSQGIEAVLSTENGLIDVNPECLSKEIPMNPDYEAEYLLSGVGKYYLTLEAVTHNGSFVVEDILEVRENLAFEVERNTATRIYPPQAYPVNIKIKANQAFKGTVKEYVPESFQVLAAKVDSVNYNRIELEPILALPQNSQPLIPSLSLPFSSNFEISTRFGEAYEDQGLVEQVIQMLNLSGHDGVDFAVAEGEPVLAVEAGEVIFSGEGDYGLTVILQHSWGQTFYGHLRSLNVEIGAKVEAGAKIAEAGQTGISTGPHLHFGLRPLEPDLNNGYNGMIDPLPYLDLNRQQNVLGELSAKNTNTQVQVLSWDLDLQPGEEVMIGYSYLAPLISPQFYLLGPLSFYEENSTDVIFAENRQWQIAVDAIGLVQSKTKGGKSSSISATYDSATTANNLLVAICANKGSVTITGPSGFSTAINESGTPSQGIFYKIAAGTETSISCSFSSSNFVGIHIYEYSGLVSSSPLDQTSSATGSSTSPSSGSINITQAEELVIVGMTVNSRTSYSGWTNSFTERSDFQSSGSPNSQNIAFAGADRYSSSIGTYTTTATSGNAAWRGQIASFKAPVTSGGPTTGDQMRHGNWFSSGTEQGFTF